MRYWHFNRDPHRVSMICDKGSTLMYFPATSAEVLEYVLYRLAEAIPEEERGEILKLYELVRVTHDKSEEH